MRSDLIKVRSTGEGIAAALAQAEAVAAYKGLANKERLQLRLLCEEMMGMFRTLTDEIEAEFYIEDVNEVFEVHLRTTTEMNYVKRKRLLDASTSGKNAASEGFTGKIRNAFETLFEPEAAGMPRMLTLGWVGDPVAVSNAEWSLSSYRNSVKNNKEAEDELERSIVASIADNITVGIQGGNVEMVIYKKF